MELSESALVQRDSRVVIRPKTIKAFGGLTGVKHTGHTGCIAHKMFNLWWEVSFKVTTLSTIWRGDFFLFFFLTVVARLQETFTCQNGRKSKKDTLTV